MACYWLNYGPSVPAIVFQDDRKSARHWNRKKKTIRIRNCIKHLLHRSINSVYGWIKTSQTCLRRSFVYLKQMNVQVYCCVAIEIDSSLRRWSARKLFDFRTRLIRRWLRWWGNALGNVFLIANRENSLGNWHNY